MRLKNFSYNLGELRLDYWLDEETQHIFMTLLPKDTAARYETRRLALHTAELVSAGMECDGWHAGALCHISVRGDAQSNGAGGTLKHGASTWQLQYVQQSKRQEADVLSIETTLRAPEGYGVTHTVVWHEGDAGVQVDTCFTNTAAHAVTLDLLTSFALDGLSPLQHDDAADKLVLHRFMGGWSLEGKHRADTVEALNLECTWFPAFPEGERYGSLGSFPVGRYFPFGAVEDKEHQLFWAAQLACNSSWQMEFSHDCDCYSLSGGLADREFGGWSKIVQPGESFAAPTAYLSACCGTLTQACQQITAMFNRAADKQPAIEQTMPIIYNDWCSVWGHPTAQHTQRIAQRLTGTPIRYIIVDAGWTVTSNDHLGQGGNGDWICDTEKFPGGMLALSRQMAQQGFVLGIWYEFEVTTSGARVYEKDYADMHVQHGGKVVVSGDKRSFWDFRKPEVVAYLNEKLTNYLRDNEISYLKVDYNGNIGSGCDGAESAGEGLRQQMQAVRQFFIELRRQLPNLVIENCAAGGHRLEPSMMQITAMGSFSDAHECREIPIIAADLHNLILPRQNQVWAVLSAQLAVQEIEYRLCACFLGRMCLSGDLSALSASQWLPVQSAMELYEQVKLVIRNGVTTRYGDVGTNRHAPRGTQVVLRQTKQHALLICHAFAAPLQPALALPIPQAEWHIAARFGACKADAWQDGVLTICATVENSATVLLLEKN